MIAWGEDGCRTGICWKKGYGPTSGVEGERCQRRPMMAEPLAEGTGIMVLGNWGKRKDTVALD